MDRTHSLFPSVANTHSDHMSTCDEKLHFLHQSQTAVTADFQALGLLVHLQQEICELACVCRNTTSAPATILGKLNTGEKELAAVEVLLLIHHMVYEQCPGRYCFNNTVNFPSPSTAGSSPQGHQGNHSVLRVGLASVVRLASSLSGTTGSDSNFDLTFTLQFSIPRELHISAYSLLGAFYCS